MNHDYLTVAVFNMHASAEAAIRRLSEAGVPIERLSIIGKGYETEEQVVGFFNRGDCVSRWARTVRWSVEHRRVHDRSARRPRVVLDHLGAGVPGIIGFAVRRTTLLEPRIALRDEKLAREATVVRIARNCRPWVDAFKLTMAAACSSDEALALALTGAPRG